MASQTTPVCQATTEQKPKSIFKQYCTCDLLADRHFASECERVRRGCKAQAAAKRRAERQQRLAQRQAKKPDGRQIKQEKEVKDPCYRPLAVKKPISETWADDSTVASEAGEVEDDWTAPLPNAPIKTAKPATKSATKQVWHFTMEEWKELQKVKKLLRQIEEIEGMQREGKQLYQNQLAKLQRRAELETCLVMVKDRAGCAPPNF